MRSYRETAPYLGDLYQMFGAKEYTFTAGKAAGVEAVDVKSGAGLEFTVLKSKCMDIAYASYKGTNFGFGSKTGIVHPSYYAEDGTKGFLRCFHAGLLTTCGLSYMGAPCVEAGEPLGLHGNIHNTPCFDAGVSVETQGDGVPCVTLRGAAREAQVFGQNLVMRRVITCRYGENKLRVCDTVTNEGFVPAPLMLLYHINFGYPFLSEETTVEIPHTAIKARDAQAQGGIEQAACFEPPMPGRAEQCYFYTVQQNKDGTASYCVRNAALGVAVRVCYDADAMPYLTQWKSAASGDYALGVEPGTFTPLGRAQARKDGKLDHLLPGASRQFCLTVEVFEQNVVK